MVDTLVEVAAERGGDAVIKRTQAEDVVYVGLVLIQIYNRISTNATAAMPRQIPNV